MADPVSISASIAGLVHFCWLTSHSTFKFIKSAKDAPGSAEKLAAEIRNLSGALQTLVFQHEAISREEFGTDADSSSPSFLATQLSPCQETLKKINNGVQKAQDDFKKPSKIAKISRSLKWPFSEEKTQILLNELGRHKQTVLLAATAQSLAELRKILEEQATLQSAFHQLEGTITKRVEAEQRVELDVARKTTRDYFLRVNPKPMLDACLKLRQSQTGRWLTETSESFLSWKSTVNARLWFTGITGCGKTILCASVIESVLQETNPKTGVAYFFCRYEEPATHRVENILSSLAAQLAIQKPEAFDLLSHSYHKLVMDLHGGLPKTPDMDDLLMLLEEICGIFGRVFVVVDGIDECGKSARAVAKSLYKLSMRAKTANIAVFSRKEEELSVTLLNELGPDQVDNKFEHADIAAQTHDIELYVSAEMKQRPELITIGSRNPDLGRMIHDRLVNGASGMFRWVACQLDYICDLDSDRARRQALNELPPTLQETYDRILYKVTQDRSRKSIDQLVKNSLHWICYAGQSLSRRQLCEAASLTPDTTWITEDDIVEESAILRRCSSLIRRSATGDRFELAHFTVKEYLQAIDPDSPLGMFRYDEYDAAQSLTMTSLRYIMFPQFGRNPTSDSAFLESLLDRNHTYRFYPFAAVQWTKAGLVQDDPEILRLSCQLFNADTPCYLNWAIQFLCDIAGIESGVNDECRAVAKHAEELKLPRLYMAAALGRAHICKHLLDQDATINPSIADGAIGSLLDCALAGPEAIIAKSAARDPANNHADPASLARTLDVLLSRAGERGRLGRPTRQVTNHRSYGVWAIAVCRAMGSADLFEPFLRHPISLEPPGAVDVLGGRGGFGIGEPTAKELSRIMAPGCAEPQFLHSLFQLILNQEKHEDHRQSAPALREMVDVVQRHIFKSGIWDGFKHQGKFETTRMSLPELSTALENAAKKGDAGHMRRLLTDRRSAHLQDDEFGLVNLRWAVSRGHKEVLEALLRASNSKQEQAERQGNRLVHYCIQDIHYSCLKMLISRGHETLTRNKMGSTIWHLAASHGSIQILELLLQSEKTDEALQMVTPGGRRPLEQALFHGHSDAALLLLRHSGLPPSQTLPDNLLVAHLIVRCNSKDLFVAAQGMGLETTRLAPDGSTPLHHMGLSTCPELARYLKTLYDIRTPRQDGLTAVQVLLQCSADSSSDSGRPSAEPLIHELLPEDHIVSRRDLHVWDFFTSRIIPKYKTWEKSKNVSNSVPFEARALITAGAVPSYERLKGQSACVPLFEARPRISQGGLPRDYCAIIAATVEATGMRETLRQYPAAIGLLKDAIHDAHMHNTGLLEVLLKKVHVDPTTRCDGESALEFLLISYISEPTARIPIFQLGVLQTVINSVERGRLNDLLPSGRGLLDHIILSSDQQKKRLEITRCLLDNGADPNMVTTEAHGRRPAIVAAAKAKSLAMIRLLLEYGANPLARDLNGWDLAKHAAQHNDLDALKLLEADRVGATYDWTTTCNLVAQTRAGRMLIEGCNMLHVAAFFGSKRIVQHLREKGILCDPDTRTANQLTPLHLAAINGKLDMIRVLVEDLGADPFARADDGALAFDLSVVCNHPKTIKMLLNLTEGSMAYLEHSICRGMLTICQEIIRQGCPVDSMVASCGGCTPLFVAVRAGKTDIARWLLQAGARTLKSQCPVHSRESSILDIAVLYLAAEHTLLQDLLSRFLEDRRGTCVPDLLNAARTAIYRKDIPALAAILTHIRDHAMEYRSVIDRTATERGFPDSILDLNPPNHGLVTYYSTEPRVNINSSSTMNHDLLSLPLLHLAAQEGLHPAAEMLVTHGADIELPDGSLRTPLAIAAAEGRADMTKYFLEIGAMVDTVDRHGWTPIMLAAARQSLEVVQILETHGANMAQLDAQGRTLLHLSAAFGNSPSVFHHLLRRGFDPYVLDNHGRCALHVAISRGAGFRSGVWDAGLLLALPDGPFNVFSDFIFSLEPTALPRLFRCMPRDKAEALVNQSGRGRRSPLCAAAITGNMEAFRMLLRLGVDMEVEGSEHGTPVMEAAAHGRLELVKVLVRHGVRMVYVSDTGVMRNVFSVCWAHSRVWRWLLVGRFTELRRLSYDTECALEGNGDATQPLSPWSGPGVFRYQLPPEACRRRDESLLEYAGRLYKLKNRVACGDLHPQGGCE